MSMNQIIMKKYILILTLLCVVTTAQSQNWLRTTTGTTYTYLNSTAVGDRIGIGPFTGSTTVVPMSRFEVSNIAVPASSDLVTFSMHSTTYYPSLRFFRSKGSLATYSDVAANEIAGTIFGSARVAANNRDVASIQFNVGSTLSASSAPGYITFSTVPTSSIVLAERMRINEAGNVGIGTSAITIQEKLHVVGNTRTSLNFLTDAGIFNVSDNTNPLILQTNGNERMRIISQGTYAGNVGIGTNNPTSNLEVVGSKIKLRGSSAPGTVAFEFDNSGVTGALEAVIGTTGVRAGSKTNYDFFLMSNNVDRMTVKTDGTVGIGTSSPASRLDVSGTTTNQITASVTADVKNGYQIKKTGTNANNWEIYNPTGKTDLKISNSTITDVLTIKSDGSVGIGTPLSGNTNIYKLAVKGKIGAHDVQIERLSNAWSDYVFESGYELLPLNQVEKYIKENGHLNGVPSAKDVEKDGYAVSTMDATLLKKIEELTLYVIAQQKEIEAMKLELAKKK
jgi:hypothetical protein